MKSKQPKVKFITICDSVIIDKNEKVSIIGIFSNINLNELPGEFGGFHIFSIINFQEKGKYRLSINIKKGPNEIYKQEADLETQKENQTINLNIRILTMIKFPEKGTYKVSIGYQSKEIGATNLELKERGQN